MTFNELIRNTLPTLIRTHRRALFTSSVLRKDQTQCSKTVLRDGAGNSVRVQMVKPGEHFEPNIRRSKKVPEYPILNIRLRGYDFQVLERFQSHVQRITNAMGAFVVESYAVPAETSRVLLYAPRTSTPVTAYELAYYERTVQLAEVSSTLLPLIFNVLRANIPEGVTVEIKENEKKDQEVRYIPDFELIKLQKNLRDLDNVFVRRKLGWME